MRTSLLIALLPTLAWAGPLSDAWKAIDEERMADATQLLQKDSSDSTERQFLDGYLGFLHGEYGRAKKQLDAIREQLGSPELKEMYRLVVSTEQVTQKYVQTASPAGHFVIRHAPGKDALLVPYAADALERAYAALAEDFGDSPTEPIRVEIVPDTDTLAQVSSLTQKEIETSGTIALCKYNRLTIVSPRALVYGYPWLDTLTHEYTHYVVSRVSHNKVPIWLHEGLAKFEERRWQKPPGGGNLSPLYEHLLGNAVEGGKLITFQRMHPSIAKLPSQEMAALAFAEVYTAVEYLYERVGWKGIRKIVELTRDRSVDKAVAAVVAAPFPRFEADWKAWLKKRGLKRRPGITHTAMRFKKTEGPSPDDETEISDKEAKKHARLGGMLRARHQLLAASVEYEKAQTRLGAGHPRLGPKLGRTYLELGHLDKAISVVRPVLERYPDTAGAQTTLGEAQFKKGAFDEAAASLNQAIALSPFDPALHCMLRDIYEKRKDQRFETERAACSTLTGH